ncbi:hypothetical protein [Rhizobium tubonense]|nr:hypothetical protein [Rhizobium tubonense]
MACARHDLVESAADASFILARVSTRLITLVGKWITHCRNTVDFVDD